MAHKFRGEATNKVDAKGRVSIPAQFRRVLEATDPDWAQGLNPNCVIVYGGASQNFLEVYTREAIAEVDAKISRLPRGSKPRRALENMFNAQSIDAQADETGRIVLSTQLRDKVGIKGEAKFVAMGDTFQIWSAEAHSSREDQIEDWIAEQGEDFELLELLDMAEGPE